MQQSMVDAGGASMTVTFTADLAEGVIVSCQDASERKLLYYIGWMLPGPGIVDFDQPGPPRQRKGPFIHSGVRV